jgi:hypothetical protein
MRVSEKNFRATETAGFQRASKHVAVRHADGTQHQRAGDDFRASLKAGNLRTLRASGRPYRTQELVDFELEAVAVAGQ